MSSLSRRDFLARSAVAVGALGAARLVARAEQPARKRSLTDRVTLGRSGVTTSLLGIGTGSTGWKHSSNQVRLGQDKFNQLIRYAYDRGICYIDTADMYGSHIFVREAIKKLPREKLFIQTKTRAQTADVARADVERFRDELGTDYIDCLLLHCTTTSDWPTKFRPVMDVLSEAKNKGSVKAVGVSCHGMEPLRAAVDCDWVDVDLARINPVGVKAMMDGTPEDVIPCLKAMHAKGKGILGMKILGNGSFKTPEEQVASIKFVLGLDCVDAMVIGFESPQQIDQILGHFEAVLKA